MRRLRSLLLLLGLLLAPLSGAWAHAQLVESAPADGARLDAAPPALRLSFDEAVTLLELRLTGPAGAVALAGPPESRGADIRATLPRDLPPGTYFASFRIISADGHPVGGGLVFGVGTVPDRAAAPVTMAAGWTLAAEALRFLLYLGFAIGAGGALFRALVAEPPPGLAHGLAATAWLGTLATLASIGVQGGGMLGAPSFLALLEGATWATATRSTVFARALVVAAGLAVVALSWRARGRGGAWAGAAGALLAALGLSLSGHAAIGGGLPRGLLVAHALTAGFWLGAFLPLLALLRQQGGGAAGAVRRFAAIAMPAVALLLGTGAGQAALHLPDVPALWTTLYGRLVLAKAAGAVLLMILAAWNHWRLTPRLGRDNGPHALRRSIHAEGLVGLAVLGVTAVLSMSSPHAGAHQHGHHHHAAAPGVAVATEAGGLSLLLEADPARAGTNRLVLHLARGDGTPLAAPEVWLEFSLDEAGISGIRRRMAAQDPGRFVLEGPELALPGRWTLRAEILVNDFEQVTAPLTLPVAP
ncbi:MAG TPA: CopD family protein [Roseomonas sp.]|nr:CopD family protein [Roseomonas sp.]